MIYKTHEIFRTTAFEGETLLTNKVYICLDYVFQSKQRRIGRTWKQESSASNLLASSQIWSLIFHFRIWYIFLFFVRQHQFWSMTTVQLSTWYCNILKRSPQRNDEHANPHQSCGAVRPEDGCCHSCLPFSGKRPFPAHAAAPKREHVSFFRSCDQNFVTKNI